MDLGLNDSETIQIIPSLYFSRNILKQNPLNPPPSDPAPPKGEVSLTNKSPSKKRGKVREKEKKENHFPFHSSQKKNGKCEKRNNETTKEGEESHGKSVHAGACHIWGNSGL